MYPSVPAWVVAIERDVQVEVAVHTDVVQLRRPSRNNLPRHKRPPVERGRDLPMEHRPDVVDQPSPQRRGAVLLTRRELVRDEVLVGASLLGERGVVHDERGVLAEPRGPLRRAEVLAQHSAPHGAGRDDVVRLAGAVLTSAIPCRAGYDVVWDPTPWYTMLRGIQCCEGYRAVRDTGP